MTYPTNQIPSINPQNFVISSPMGCERNPRDPTPQDNTFPPSWEWQNTVTGMFWKCVSATIAGAVWVPFVPSSAGTVATLTGNSGGPVGPNGSGNIDVKGDGTTISIAGNPGTNTLTVSLIGGSAAIEQVDGNTGSVTPTAGVINIIGALGVSTSGSGSTLTIVATGGGFTWNDVTTATRAIVVENGYVTNRLAGVTYTLPANAIEGNVFRIAGKAGLWTIAQNAGQQILVSSASTSVGVLGSVVATNTNDAIELLCTTGGANTVWTAISFVGNLTIN